MNIKEMYSNLEEIVISKKIENIWMILAPLAMIALSLFWKENLIGFICSVTGVICVALVSKGSIKNYWFGIINVITYAYLALQANYMGEVMLNALFYLPMQFIGLYMWNKNLKKNVEIQVKKLSISQWLYGSLGTLIVIGIYGLVLIKLGSNLPFIDSTTTILSIIAMILMNARYSEQWLLWIIINVFTIYLWLMSYLSTGESISILIMWCIYLINSIYGCIKWNATYNKQN